MPGISGDIQNIALDARFTAWIRSLLSFSGRATRKDMIGVLCMLLIGVVTLKAEGTVRWWPAQIVTVVSMLFLLWVYVATTVRRLHDVGRSGHWFFLQLVPVASQCMTLALCCVPAKQGDNDYGADPRLSNERVLPLRWKVIACAALYWCLLSFMVSTDGDTTESDRWLELLIMVAFPTYLLWLPWWLWTTFKERHDTDPSRSWKRRLGIAVSVVWLLAVACIAFAGFSESTFEACFVIVLFGVVPLGFLWFCAWLWNKFRARRLAT